MSDGSPNAGPSASRPTVAMVLAAGLGKRMRAFDPTLPKPLVALAGRALLDHVLDRLADAAIATAVVNVHHMADRIEHHLAGRIRPRIVISDERAALLETGGGVKLAHSRGLLGPAPFLVHNSDSVWLEQGVSNISRLLDVWAAGPGDGCLMLLARRDACIGYSGRGDFALGADGCVARPAAGEEVAFVFAGVSIMAPQLLAGTPDGPFSLNRVWDRAIAEGRVRGLVLEGTWMHVGDPAAHAAAERRISEGRR